MSAPPETGGTEGVRGVAGLVRQLDDVLRAHGLDPLERAETALGLLAHPDQAHSPVGLARRARGAHPQAVAAAGELLDGHRDLEALRSAATEHFADGVRRRWAQHHTPAPIARLMAEIVAPPPQGMVVDPAVGGGELLWAVHDRSIDRHQTCPDLVGVDRATPVVRAAHLQARLRGADGHTVLVEGDSLLTPRPDPTVDVVVCNPPFGTRLTEDRTEVLAGFDLGHRWTCHPDDNRWQQGKLLDRQELGVLFVELAVRSVTPGTGRIAIIVPNGYLSNRSSRYVALRAWLVRHTRIAALVGLPRFAFKALGSDVTATIVIAERRAHPLDHPGDGDDHPIAVELLEPRGTAAGTVEGTVEGTATVLASLASSPAADELDWLAAGHRPDPPAPGHAVTHRAIAGLNDLNLDPRRHSGRHHRIRAQVSALAHFRIGEVAEVLDQLTTAQVRARRPEATYRYVDLAATGIGTSTATDIAGRDLPARARHHAQLGDLFVAGIWGSAGKWFIAGPEADLVVSNGFHRLAITDETLAVDLLAGLCTETFTTQLRALARGSDGLAEITPADLTAIVLPRLPELARSRLAPLAEQLRTGAPTLHAVVHQLTLAGSLPGLDSAPRASNRSPV